MRLILIATIAASMACKVAASPADFQPPLIPPLEDKVKETVLPNGLKVVVVERHNAPVFFTLITFRVGSTNEDANRSGLSHFMEHMLFKGSQTLGTFNYKLEKPIMDELERTAGRLREIQFRIGAWRLTLFDEFATEIKQGFSKDLLDSIGSSESAMWLALKEALPTDEDDLPAEWVSNRWTISEDDFNYWDSYRETLGLRASIADLQNEQRKYIVQSALDEIYDRRGGRSLNAYTSYDETTYMVGLPSNCLELWMSLESDRFQNPVFREFYAEREVVMEELRMRENDPGSRLYKTILNNAFIAHPYGRPIIGWKSDIETTLRGEMEAYYRRYYAPNNCQLTIVGDVDSDQVFKLARRYFASWKPAEIANEVRIVEPPQTGEKRVEVEYDAEPQLLIGWHIPAAPHPDYYPLELLSSILSAGRTSRFYKSIYVEKGLTAEAPWANAGVGNRYPGLFFVGAVPKAPHTCGEVEAAVYEELASLAAEPVSTAELERVRNRYQVNQLRRLRSNQWLAFSLSSGFVSRGDWRTVTEDYERIMMVTAEDIKRVAAKYFTKSNRTVAVIVKKEDSIAADVTTGGGK